jgi:amino-acid N-acetyltransferase
MVNEAYQGKGIGRGIVEEMIREGKELDVKKIFTLTYVKGFFESLEFEEIPKETLPAHKIWADCIKCKYFPVCEEVALIKVI